jgi:hypothetical protein
MAGFANNGGYGNGGGNGGQNGQAKLPNNMSGRIRPNRTPKGPKSPNFVGRAMINGQLLIVSAWYNPANGALPESFSLQFNIPQEQQQGQPQGNGFQGNPQGGYQPQHASGGYTPAPAAAQPQAYQSPQQGGGYQPQGGQRQGGFSNAGNSAQGGFTNDQVPF